jgi:hypothetical protein
MQPISLRRPTIVRLHVHSENERWFRTRWLTKPS